MFRPRALHIAVPIAILVLIGVLAFAFYGPIASWVLRNKVLPKVSAKLGRSISVHDLDVRRGQARLYNVVVSGENDGERPLARIGEIAVEFDFWGSLSGDVNLGKVVISGPNIVLRKAADGSDNYSDILSRLKKRGQKAEGTEGSGSSRIQLENVHVSRGRVEAHDETRGVTAIGYNVALGITGRDVLVNVGEAAALSSFGAHLKLSRAQVTFSLDDPTKTIAVDVADGESRLWRGMVLTGIVGKLAQSSVPGTLVVDLEGSYGGANEKLWSVEGEVAPASRTGYLELSAERFTFDRLSTVLADHPYVRDYEKTSLNASARLTVDPDNVSFVGEVGIRDLNLEHPMLASQPVTDIEGEGALDAHYSRKERVLTVRSAKLRTGKAKLELQGEVAFVGGYESETGLQREYQRLSLQAAVPKVACSDVLAAIPSGLASEIAEFRLSGNFESEIAVKVDWADLKATEVKGSIDIDGCRVLASPAKLSTKRLESSFRHNVLIGEDEYRQIRVGPENPDFVAIEDISPYLTLAFVTREDATFYTHDGFINREFKRAIVKNLEEGRFAYGASSITMQTVKNVFLTREKTISRKLQELFLTWYVETQLDKDRIMEIYVNAIEYGPGLYGLGPAADVYFEKHPRDLTPMEAVFLATLLPSPRTYYEQFCKDRLNRSIDRKIWKTIELMLERELITEEQFFLARTLPLEFSADKRRLCNKNGGYQPSRRRRRNPEFPSQ